MPLLEMVAGLGAKVSYDLVKIIVASTLKEDNENLVNEGKKAIEAAIKKFFAKFGDQFGKPSSSFLERQENWDIIVRSCFYSQNNLTYQDIDPRGFDGAPNATQEAIEFFVNSLQAEMSKSWELDKILHEKCFQEKVEKKLENIAENTQAILINLGLAADEDLEGVTILLRDAARVNIEAFKRERKRPHLVLLNMTMKDSDGVSHALNLEGVAFEIASTNEISIVAAPGMGKTTTMIQLAQTILASNKEIAIFIPLAEWSSHKEHLFQSLTQRDAFCGFHERHFKLLTHCGRLTLLLDGWNELDSQSKQALTLELIALRREYPFLRIAISTRRQALNLPMNGPVIEIESLTRKQQMEIAFAFHGDDGIKLLDQAWRTERMSELICIPLYLDSLLVYAKSGNMPTTKEEVLRVFVEEHEKECVRAEILDRVLFGSHKEILAGLAVAATITDNTTIPDAQAKKIVSQIDRDLVAAEQITRLPQPKEVLDTLVNQHLLIRTDANNSVSFQHQQFQEWYASIEVEKLMRSSEGVDAEAAKKLSVNVLNMPAWEEAILFACERLSGGDQAGIKALAAAILKCLSIDPMLAAEMIFRSSQAVWDIIKDATTNFAARWHQSGILDRAVGFMIATGQPEFAEQIWPFIINPDANLHFGAFRIASQFRPSVLGANIKDRMANLSEEIRKNIVSEIIMESGIKGIELATDLAKSDSSANVQFEAIESLLFRRAESFALEILKVAQPSVWDMLVRKEYVNEIADVEIGEKLVREHQIYVENEAGACERINFLLEKQESDLEIGAQIEKLIDSDELPINDDQVYWTLLKASAQYPHEVAKAIVRRIETGRGIPYRASELLKNSIVLDDGAIVDMILDTTRENRVVDDASVVAGPRTISTLVEKLLVLDEKISKGKENIEEGDRKEYWCLIERISKSKLTSFLPVLQKYSDIRDPQCIQLLADLINRHRSNGEKRLLKVPKQLMEPLVNEINRWIETLLLSAAATRQDFAEMARVITRIPNPVFFDGLQRLLESDLAQEKASKSTCSYTNIYRDAFSAIGTDNVVQLMFTYLRDFYFGIDAACVLKNIWEKQQNIEKKIVHDWPDFAEAGEKHCQRKRGEKSAVSLFSDKIFSAIEELSQSLNGVVQHQHLLRLARIGISLPHGDKYVVATNLLSLPGLLREKQALLNSLTLAGYTISVHYILEGLSEFLEEAKTKSWLLDEHNYQIEEWLALIPFSDRPETLSEALSLVMNSHKGPRRLSRLLSALSYAPNSQADLSLFKIAEDDPRFYNEYEWLEAVVRRGTALSTTMLLDQICDGKLSGRGIDSWSLARKISGLFKNHPDVYRDLIYRYRKSPNASKAILKEIMTEVATEEGLLALVLIYSEAGQNFDQTLVSMIKNIALGKQYLEQSQVYQYYGVDSSDLRRKLFSRLIDGGALANLAESCLIEIDKLRDEYGRVNSEPRHPDVESGRPWPIVP